MSLLLIAKGWFLHCGKRPKLRSSKKPSAFSTRSIQSNRGLTMLRTDMFYIYIYIFIFIPTSYTLLPVFLGLMRFYVALDVIAPASVHRLSPIGFACAHEKIGWKRLHKRGRAWSCPEGTW